MEWFHGLFFYLIIHVFFIPLGSAQVNSIYVEAEEGEIELPMQIGEDEAAFGGTYVEVAAGYNSTDTVPSMGKAIYTVNLKEGEFKIWGRVRALDGGNDSFWVQVDDGTIYQWNQIEHSSSWIWDAVHDNDDNNTNDEVIWNLEAGEHQITIYYREDGTQIDQLYLTNLGDTPPNTFVVPEKTIYISHLSGIDENNEGSSPQNPIKSLARAYEIAHQTFQQVGKYNILLKAGETFSDFQPLSNDVLTSYDPLRNTFAFIWDLDRQLHLSTYGVSSTNKALLYSNQYTYEGGPTAAIAVVEPSTQAVVIENLHFKRWQVCAIFTYETQHIEIANNIIEEIGTLFFPDEQTPGIFGAGVLYPKNTTNAVLRDNYIRNVHNTYADLEQLHAFYLTRLSQAEIYNNVVINASGAPIKFRREANNNVWLYDNAFYYTGPSAQTDDIAQRGFVRYSGDANGGCPFALTIENNKFYYPYCWEDIEDCQTAIADKCSVSNPAVCGAQACENDERIQWINNDFRYGWESYEVPAWPMERILTSTKEMTNTPPTSIEIRPSPNPFRDHLSLELRYDRPLALNLALFNSQGALIDLLLDQVHINNHATIKYTPNQSLPTGIYFLRWHTANESGVLKLIRLN